MKRKKLLKRNCDLTMVKKSFAVKPELSIEYQAAMAYFGDYVPITDEYDSECEFANIVLETPPDQEKRAMVRDILSKLSLEASEIWNAIVNTPLELLESIQGRNVSPQVFKNKIINYLCDNKGLDYDNILCGFDELKDLSNIVED